MTTIDCVRRLLNGLSFRTSSFRILLGLLLPVFLSSSASAFELDGRWTRTATDGFGISLGDPITLTWGIVPNGTPSTAEGPSDLLSFLDTNFGVGPGGTDLTQRPWFTHFEQSFDRWGEVSGLTYEFEPADDGATHSSNSNRGVLGVRADIRVAGSFIDGNNGVLAFNFFPNNGDMTLDTGDVNFYTDDFADFRPLRNVIMHEHGHGIGLSHIESSNRRFLMEPFLSTAFDGPQFDDILAAHRGYGDALEKTNNGAGNDTASNASDLGVIVDGGSVKIGRDGRTAIVAPTETDFVSIDDNGDTDYFSFTLDEASQVNIDLEAVGPTYNEGPQGGAQSSFVTSELSNLNLALFGTDGTTLLMSDDSGGLGGVDSISDFNLGAGEYFVRIMGAANAPQMYELEIAANIVALASPDFNGDGQLNFSDIDELIGEVVFASNDLDFDLNGDGIINQDDITEWLAQAGATNNPSGGAYLPGDANLDGAVDLTDLHIYNENRDTGFVTKWSAGDFNASGSVNIADFDILNSRLFQNSADFANVVPEPSSGLLMLVSVALMTLRKRRRIEN